MLNLTKQEQQVTVFLLSLALCGIGIKMWRKTNFQPRLLADFSQNAGKINLNQANFADLKSVSGIGDKTAQRVLEYRRHNGRFNSLNELENIKGINKFRFEKIKDSFYVE